MPKVVIKNPVLNSPYDEQKRHFDFDEDGITDQVVDSRRISSYFVPIPKPKKKGKQLNPETELAADRIEENKLFNDIRRAVASWRMANYACVTATTRQLLQHWSSVERERRIYFCQFEALGTAIWSAEVADRQDGSPVRQAYFTGADEPYEKLKRALRAEIEESAWSELYSTVSGPFPKQKGRDRSPGETGIKVINHNGDEVLKVNSA